jgi:hypothetical protein
VKILEKTTQSGRKFTMLDIEREFNVGSTCDLVITNDLREVGTPIANSNRRKIVFRKKTRV